MGNEFSFLYLCKQSFGILLSRFGFSIAEVRKYYVRYESKNIYIKILYDEREGEILVYVGELLNSEYRFELDFKHEFSLNELLAEIRPEKVYKSRIFRDSQDIEVELHRLVNVLEEEKDILNGKVEIFPKLLKNRIKVQEEQEKNEYINDIKKKAEHAFKKSDFASMISLYKKIEPELTSIERKKYKIALGRIKKGR